MQFAGFIPIPFALCDSVCHECDADQRRTGRIGSAYQRIPYPRTPTVLNTLGDKFTGHDE